MPQAYYYPPGYVANGSPTPDRQLGSYTPQELSTMRAAMFGDGNTSTAPASVSGNSLMGSFTSAAKWGALGMFVADLFTPSAHAGIGSAFKGAMVGGIGVTVKNLITGGKSDPKYDALWSVGGAVAFSLLGGSGSLMSIAMIAPIAAMALPALGAWLWGKGKSVLGHDAEAAPQLAPGAQPQQQAAPPAQPAATQPPVQPTTQPAARADPATSFSVAANSVPAMPVASLNNGVSDANGKPTAPQQPRRTTTAPGSYPDVLRPS